MRARRAFCVPDVFAGDLLFASPFRISTCGDQELTTLKSALTEKGGTNHVRRRKHRGGERRHPSDESERGVACSLWRLLPRNSLGLFGYKRRQREVLHNEHLQKMVGGVAASNPESLHADDCALGWKSRQGRQKLAQGGSRGSVRVRDIPNPGQGRHRVGSMSSE